MRRGRSFGLAGLLVAAVVAVPAPAWAHERWFVPGEHPTDWGFAARPLALSLLATVVALTLVWRAVAVRLRTPELPVLRPLGTLVRVMPRLLAIHLGVALLALSVRGEFLSPALPVHHVPAGELFAVVQVGLGGWLISGIRLRWAGAAVAALGPVLFAAGGLVTLAENAALLGIATFLVIAAPSGRGEQGSSVVGADRLGLALLVLRFGAATSLVALAFSEKLANPSMARAMLEVEPRLNVVSVLGVSLSTDTFIVIAGAIELLFGLLVLSGAAPQAAVLVAAVPFNATLFLFGATEVVGHLPIYGILLALLVYGSNVTTAPLVRSFDVRHGAADPARQRSAQPA
jgi:hypothetical protein